MPVQGKDKMSLRRASNEQFVGLFRALISSQNLPLLGAFGYPKARNLKILKKYAKKIDEINGKPSSTLKEFSLKEIDLLKKFADKDKEGNPIKMGNEFQIIKKEDKCKRAIAELRLEYQDTLNELVAKQKEIKDWLEQESEEDLYLVKADLLPDGLPGAAYDYLDLMVNDSSIEIVKPIKLAR